MDAYTVGVLTNIGLFSFLALSAYVLLVAGEMSFGQQAFFGVGAYTAGMATAMFGLPLTVATAAAMVLGALGAVLVGLPTLRLRGLYVGVISNWDNRLRPLLAAIGLAGRVDSITVSCEVGAEKPDAAIFRAALQAGKEEGR